MEMQYDIAVGKSRSTKTWSQRKVTFKELYERLNKPTRTTETVEEYAKMNKSARDSIKDVGGFVGGTLKNGIRKNETVLSRSLITLDIDNAKPDLAEIIEMLGTFKAILYSTHSHTPKHPRLRLIIPLTRDITAEEYAAVSKFIAAEWGMEMFDQCSFKPSQLMYWPSCSIDAEYICECIDGDVLDPDEILSAHSGWDTDLAKVPQSRDETTNKVRQKDPLEKEGIVGAFCRVYTISAAIAVFLSNVYAPTSIANRLDYTPADSMAGVMVYDDKFAYSHHATDPAFGQELNAFDLVRVHKFNEDDPKKSFEEMADFARTDPAVRRQLGKDKAVEASKDFEEEDNDIWTLLDLDRNNKVKNSPENFLAIMRNDPNLKGICYNMLTSAIGKKTEVPWEQVKAGWSDQDFYQLQAYLVEKYGISGKDNLRMALETAAAERKYHPIIDYFENLPEWDGIERVETLLIDYLDADDNIYTREATLKTLQAAMERVYNPGIKFDTALIIRGRQGIGKTMLFEFLGKEWYSSSLSLNDMKSKDAAEKLQGYWIMEIAELNGMRKAEVEAVKAFMTRTDDQYRASYGMYVTSHKRQSIIVGTTNEENGFLRDTTGNRRFWVIEAHRIGEGKPGDRHVWDMNNYDLDMLWAEVKELRKAGPVNLLLSREALELAEQAQENAMEHDARIEIVAKYLEILLPADWQDMNALEKRRFIADSDDGVSAVGLVRRDRVSPLEIWCECFGKDAAYFTPIESRAISGMLKALGWEKEKKVSRLKAYDKIANYYQRR